MSPRPLIALAAALAAGCGGPDAPPAPAADLEVGTAQEAFDACRQGDLEAGIGALDVLVRRDTDAADPLVLRGLCHWTRWDETGDAADAERAYEDLSQAIAALEAGGADAATPLDRAYSYRAFVAHALDDGWDRTAQDLDRAAQLAPANATHAMDHGVARTYAGDTAEARRELERFLAMTSDSADAQRRDLAESLLDDLEAE